MLLKVLLPVASLVAGAAVVAIAVAQLFFCIFFPHLHQQQIGPAAATVAAAAAADSERQF